MKVCGYLGAKLAGIVLASTLVAWAGQAPQAPVAMPEVSAAAQTLDQYVGQYREPSEPDTVDSVYLDGGKCLRRIAGANDLGGAGLLQGLLDVERDQKFVVNH